MDGVAAWFRGLIEPGQAPGPGALGSAANSLERIRLQLREHPVPSQEQTMAFAEHVAKNHSWYKHLPSFPPGTWFVFALNPNAGRQYAWWEGEGTYYDIPRGDPFAHHSRRSTTEYRDWFGIWDYIDLDGSNPAPGNGILPDAFRCRLTSFLRVHPMHDIMVSRRLQEHLPGYREFARQHPDDPDVLRYRKLEAWASRSPEERLETRDEVKAFAVVEGGVQMDRLRRTLSDAREGWARLLGRQG